jgi:hypothetical protein
MVERAANQKADGEARSNFAKSACKAPDFQGIVCISHPASRPAPHRIKGLWRHGFG